MAGDPGKKTMTAATADPAVVMTMMIVEATAADAVLRRWMRKSAAK